jgi:hypothetical protein
MFLIVRHEAAQEMRICPSEPVCRSRLRTTLSCSGRVTPVQRTLPEALSPLPVRETRGASMLDVA